MEELYSIVKDYPLDNISLCFHRNSTSRNIETSDLYSSLYNFMKLHREVPVFPKLHYLVHLSGQILQFGSGRSHMCTRHGLLKNKSLSLSVALHHQRWMCLRQCGFGSEKPMFTCMEVTKFRMDVKF